MTTPTDPRVEAVARALYEQEKARSDRVDTIFAAAKKSQVKFRMEHWDDVADLYRGDARAAIAAMDAHLPPDLAELEAAHAASTGLAEELHTIVKGTRHEDDALALLDQHHDFIALAHLHLPALLARLRKLEAALVDRVNPLGKLEREAEAGGNRLSGMAYSVANDLAFVQSIARAALQGQEP